MSADSKITFGGKDFDFYDYNGSYSDDYNESCCGGVICDQESSMYFDSIFIPVLYSLALVVGLVGNGLVVVVLWKKRMGLNVTDIFILHLSVADILLLLTLPFWAVEAANEWIFGTVLCKLTGALFKVGKRMFRVQYLWLCADFCIMFKFQCSLFYCFMHIFSELFTWITNLYNRYIMWEEFKMIFLIHK